MSSCRCASTCPGQRSHAFTTCADCVLSVGNLAVMSLPNWRLRLSCRGWIIVTSYSPAFHPRHWRHCRGCAMSPLVCCGPTTPRPRITGPPGIALATDRQEDQLQAVPIGPQGVDRAGADVHRRHVDTCLQCPVTEHSALSHQRRLHRAAYTSQAWREGFLSRRT